MSLVMPAATITSIGDNAFRNCTNLTSIVIPSSVTSIDHYSFQGCTSLTSVTVERWMPDLAGTAQITTAGTNLFGSSSGQWNTALRIVVPAGSVAAYKAATNWSSSQNIRNRIHAVGCSVISVTANCTQCE